MFPRQFVWQYVRAQISIKYRHTYLGILWNVLEPALFLGVLGVIFSVVNRMQVGDYLVFLFSALVPWRYFESAVSGSMESIVGGEWLLKRMYVSPFIFPLARWMIASIEFLIAYGVALAILLAVKSEWTIHVLLLPLAMLVWATAALGMGMICAVLFTLFRDIKPVVQMGLLFLFFSSPILIRVELFQGHPVQSALIEWHPLTYFAALFQKPIYYLTFPSSQDWLVSVGASLAALALGVWLIHRYRGRFYFYL